MLWTVEDLVAVTLLHDGAAQHHHDLVGQVLHDRKIVRYKQIGQPELLLQIEQQVEDAGLNRHVERRHRLVEREDLGPQRQRPRDPDALLLPAGELTRIPAGIGVPQPDGVEQLGDPRAGVGLAESVGVQRLSQQIENRQSWIQRRRRVLEDDLDVAP